MAYENAMKNILVIIPTYEEVDNIGDAIGAIERTAERSHAYHFELLIVDDSSPDGTAQEVRKLQRKYNNLHLLSGRKVGLGQAYIRGFRYALETSDCEAVVMMDADLSHDPADIPKLLRTLDKGTDYVIGSRYTSGGAIPGSWSLRRIVISRVANYVAHILVGTTRDISDMTGGFKAIRRAALEEIDLTAINVNGYVFQVSLLHAFLSHGFRVKEIPITFGSRQNGTSKFRLRDVSEFLYHAYKLNPDAPIQRFVRFGLVGACGSAVNLATLTFLVQIIRINPFVSVAAAIEFSILFNFLLNHYYTFRGYGAFQQSTRREPLESFLRKMVIFNFGALGGAAITFGVFTFFFKVVHLHYLLADAIAIVVAMGWNYWMSTRFVWKTIDIPPKL